MVTMNWLSDSPEARVGKKVKPRKAWALVQPDGDVSRIELVREGDRVAEVLHNMMGDMHGLAPELGTAWSMGPETFARAAKRWGYSIARVLITPAATGRKGGKRG
jgi:hypothetical protein